MKNRVVVIGGGPAGVMAAGQAALAGADVVLLEKMERPLKKLLLTGNGRCNITNSAPLNGFINHFNSESRLAVKRFLSQFSPADLRRFLLSIGIPTVEENEGRIFPVSQRATEVADALVLWLKNTGVVVETGTSAVSLRISDDRITGVETVKTAPGSTHKTACSLDADAVIVATGGLSYPQTGCTGDGYRLARESGHSIAFCQPALVPIISDSPVIKELQGLSLSGIKVRLIIDDKKATEASGDILFTHYGLSGPIILSMSRLVVDALRTNKQVAFSIDLKPALDEKQLDTELVGLLVKNNRQQIASILKSLLPKRLIPVCCTAAKISLEQLGHQISALERKEMKKWFKDFRIRASGHLSFNEAMVTSGGIALLDVKGHTLESNRISGLYFAGELLDIDADTGGFNLQSAFTTGWIAGRGASGTGLI